MGRQEFCSLLSTHYPLLSTVSFDLPTCAYGFDLVESEILGGAVVAGLPVEEHHAVAFGGALLGADAELLAHGFDPDGRAFELGVGADGRLVEEDVAFAG